MDIVREYFKGDALAELLNMTIESVEPGHAVITMPLDPRHMNSLNVVHGGSVFSLADFCFAVSSNSHGRVAVAVNANISYFRGAQSGTLRAEGRELHCGERIAGYQVDVTDISGALIATMQGLVYRKKVTLREIIARRGTPLD